MVERWKKFLVLHRERVLTVRLLHEHATILLFILHINHVAGSKLSRQRVYSLFPFLGSQCGDN
jgi:hypothetical protein